MKTLLVVLSVLCLAACSSPSPSGPTIMNSGDGNSFNGIGGDGNTKTTPAPVNPVVVAQPGSEILLLKAEAL